jgi:hypothetical protein
MFNHFPGCALCGIIIQTTKYVMMKDAIYSLFAFTCYGIRKQKAIFIGKESFKGHIHLVRAIYKRI